MIHEENNTFNKKMEIKKNQIETVDLENTVDEIKSIYIFNRDHQQQNRPNRR